jgi:uncharacterized glyoxalase superfamily protein PhnB
MLAASESPRGVRIAGVITVPSRPLWDKLADGAIVIAPLLTAQSAAPSYGMFTDRFGVTWIFGVTPS